MLAKTGGYPAELLIRWYLRLAIAIELCSDRQLFSLEDGTMSVILETSLGDITIDLYTKDCPNTTKNFLKLCKLKYFNNCLFHNVQRNFMVQTGDPTGTGSTA